MSPKSRTNKILLLLTAGLFFLASCNKDLPKAVPIVPPANGVTPTLATLLDDPSFSILKAAVTKAGLLDELADPALRFTLFAPDNNALTASGISMGIVDALPAATVYGLISYHIVPQVVSSANIPTSFPNLQYPTLLNPAPSVSALLRLTTFPSKRGSTAWVNNIPVIAADATAVNGVLHKVARAVAPPTQFLWERIVADPNLNYLEAAIIRADSGAAPGTSLVGYLTNIGANFTVFAPTDAAFKTTLTGAIYVGVLPLVTQQLIGLGYTPAQAAAAAPPIALTQATALASTSDVFKNPALYSALSAQTVKGIVVYHILGTRAFSVNLPTTATNVPTLLNTVFSTHPGVSIAATFGPTGVTAATVKGVGNQTTSKVLINPTPAPGGTSDQHYLNGVLHVIDQVLLPQ
jgi:uncharacterized surface protein with fasciclin (FAS1) repeats